MLKRFAYIGITLRARDGILRKEFREIFKFYATAHSVLISSLTGY
jgi:hypothetical protein